MGEQKPDRGKYDLDQDRLDRLAKNVSGLLSELLEGTREIASRSEASRKRVFVDLRALLQEIPLEDHGVVLTRLESEVQRTFDLQGSPKVSFGSGCLGRSGGSISATEGGVTVGACAIVEGGRVTGGGVEGSFSY